LRKCPIYEKNYAKVNVINNLKKDFRSFTNSVFVGWGDYPNVFAGVLTPINNDSTPDNPHQWVNNRLSINDIMNYRVGLVNSRSRTHVKQSSIFKETVQLSALSSKPLNIDVSLKDKPKLSISFNQFSPPMGPTGEVVKATLIDNPSIPRVVSKVFDDYDFKASEAMVYLNKKLSEYDISKLLSAGTLGVKIERKLVPTRWAITATDDTLAKECLTRVRNYSMIDKAIVFNGSYFGNIFTVLLMPGPWSYELFEIWNPGAVYTSTQVKVSTDFEGYWGRKNYASETGGGYYASRLPVVKWLDDHKIQASVVAIRIVTPDYYMPLGVWVVRQAITNALESKTEFNDLKLAKQYVQQLTNFDLRRSRLASNTQSRLNKFF